MELRQICNDNNILLIADEVQCGSGRTGNWWNVSEKNIIPDLMTFGKGIASGYPLAGVVSSSDIMNNVGKGFLGGTYGGNAISSIASSATIDIIQNENLLNNTKEKGNILNDFFKNFDEIIEIRQYGLMIGLTFREDIKSIQLLEELRNNNILVLLCGNNNQYIRLLPPLNIGNNEIDFFMDGFKKSLEICNKKSHLIKNN